MKTSIEIADKSRCDELRQWIEGLPGSFESGGELVYKGRNELRLFELDGRRVVAKRYRRNGLLLRVIRRMGRSFKARNAYFNAKRLLLKGFRTPAPVAMVEKTDWSGVRDAYYLCEETHLPDLKQRLGNAEWDPDLAGAFGRYVARMHQTGVIHYDLNITNVLWEERDGEFDFELIDINRMLFSDLGFSDEDCLENLTLFTGREDLFLYVAQRYVEARGKDWDMVHKAYLVKKSHDRRWRFRKRLAHPFRKAAVVALMVAATTPTWGQCPTSVKKQDAAAMAKAVEAYEARHYVDANAQLKKLMARNPNAADVYFYLGMVAAKQDVNPAAIRKYFTKTITLCEDYPNALAHYYMGVIYYTDARYEEAARELDRYFDMANNSGNAEYEAVYADASSYLHWSRFLGEAELNKAPFNPIVAKGLSSKHDEMLPYITWDGSQAYYLRLLPEEGPKTFYTRQMVDKHLRMMLSRKNDKGDFGTGDVLPAPFNQHENEGGVSITADNATLYYSVLKHDASGYGNCDIYYSEFRGGVWTDIKPVGQQVNAPKSWESQPSISADGRTLYFASNRPGGQGGIDIWCCHKLKNGDWSRPENLGPSINTAGNEKCPFIHADGHTLYFASDGWQGFGGYDMYFANLNDNSAAFPTNLGLPFNTEGDDICLGIIADGSKAYFSGKMPEVESVGGKDIYMFELYPAARPEPMKVVPTGVWDMDMKPLEGRITVKRYGADDAVYTGSAMMLSLKEDNVVVAEAEGYLPYVNCYSPKYVKDFASSNLANTLPPLKVGAYAPLVQMRLGQDKKSLAPVSRKILDAYVLWLQAHPMVHVEVQSGSLTLSQAIFDYLVQSKLRRDRLSIGNNVADANGGRLTIKKM